MSSSGSAPIDTVSAVNLSGVCRFNTGAASSVYNAH